MSQAESPVGFVLFGLGRAGHIHANTLIRNPQARLKYIVDIDTDKAKKFVTSNYLDTKVVTPSDLETVLRDPSVNAAVITTPTHLHEDLVVSCLKAGKAVFCEKPIATTVEAIGERFMPSTGVSKGWGRGQRLQEKGWESFCSVGGRRKNRGLEVLFSRWWLKVTQKCGERKAGGEWREVKGWKCGFYSGLPHPTYYAH